MPNEYRVQRNHVNVTLDLTNSNQQELLVNITWTPVSLRQEFCLPIWTPGSYKVRDHSQYLYNITLSQGDRPIILDRLDTSQWIANLENYNNLSLNYIIQARELTVRTSYINPDFASINLSSVVVLVNGFRRSVHKLHIRKKSNWRASIPLTHKDNYYYANNYDQLLDSPLIAGESIPKTFYVNEKEHQLLCIGKPPWGWPDNFLHDISLVCEAVCKLFKEEPPSGDKYLLVLQMLDKAYGGLEHENSAVLQYDWRALAKKDGYRKLLQLIAHEYLHQWNVKRLRPREFLNYNYSKVIITDSLWFAEGVTSYYDLAMPMISGLSSEKDFLEDLSLEITAVFNTPGNKIHSLADSSRESWIKLYNSTLPSKDTQINYYKNGTLLSLCLDVKLRQKGYSLAVLLRNLWIKYGKTNLGYTRQEIKIELTSLDLNISNELDIWLDEPDSLPLLEIIKILDLRLDKIGEPEIYSGLHVKEKANMVIVSWVEINSPACKAGLVIDDELIAINNYRIRELEDIKRIVEINEQYTLTFFRQGMLRSTKLTTSSADKPKWSLSLGKSFSELRNKWLQII